MLTVTNYDRRKAAMNETTQTTTSETDATMTSSAPAFDVESQREEQHDNETVEEDDTMQDRQRCFRFLPPTSKLVEMLCTGSAPPRSPSKVKMAVLTFLMIWIQVHFLVQAYASLPALSSYPLAVEAVTIFTVVFSTEFLWMPIGMYVLSFWLFPKPKQAEEDGEQKQDRKQQQDDSEQSTISMTVRSREEAVE
mmetsp:Transcript_18067/g.43745  ORF Transcript_18067/g.43745 Transcript_18067/m.43745 type:complete len:194 (-) Transcript_18067:61-642(-)